MRRKARRCGHSAAKRTPSTPWRTVLPTGRSVRAHRPTGGGETDTRSSRKHLRRSSRRRRRHADSRSRDWRRRRRIGLRMARRRRRWRLPSSNTASSRGACCRPWTRTTVRKSSGQSTSWARRVSAHCWYTIRYICQPLTAPSGDHSPLTRVFVQLLGDHIKVVVFSCSEYEAKNYGMWSPSQFCVRLSLPVGRFLLGILTDLYKWFSDEALYEQDNRTKAGGKIHYLPGFQQSWSPKFPVEKTSILAWHNFQQVLRKWHRKLFKVRLNPARPGNCAQANFASFQSHSPIASRRTNLCTFTMPSSSSRRSCRSSHCQLS